MNRLEFLNISDLKGIGNNCMKSISTNLSNKLQDLCIFGSYFITDQGLLSLCMTKSETLLRLNYCGCYKISEDSRLWLSNSFKQAV